MYTQAKVIEVTDDKTALVSCASAACGGCKASLFCNNKNHTTYEVKYSGKCSFGLQKGDTVRLYMPPAKTILSTLMVFALPLALFPVGYFLVKYTIKLNEIMCALSGFGMMGISFGIASIISVKNRRRLMPEVVEVIKRGTENEVIDN